MKEVKEITQALNLIRKILDEDVIDLDIEMQKNKLLKLTQLIGLSAECNASAKKLLHKKELDILKSLPNEMAAMRMNKTLSAECFEESAILEYSDRINSALIHSIDAIRSVISLYKTELENSLKS